VCDVAPAGADSRDNKAWTGWYGNAMVTIANRTSTTAAGDAAAFAGALGNPGALTPLLNLSTEVPP
jgi:hypothetical protein